MLVVLLQSVSPSVSNRGSEPTILTPPFDPEGKPVFRWQALRLIHVTVSATACVYPFDRTGSVCVHMQLQISSVISTQSRTPGHAKVTPTGLAEQLGHAPWYARYPTNAEPSANPVQQPNWLGAFSPDESPSRGSALTMACSLKINIKRSRQILFMPNQIKFQACTA